MKNILITSVGKRVVLVKCFQKTLRQLGLDAKVYTTDMNPKMSPAGYLSDGCHEVPRCTSPDYIDQLLYICESFNIGLVIPTIDTELMVLAESSSRFSERGIFLAVSDLSFIHTCRDKRLTSQFFSYLGISTPRLIDKHHPSFPMFAKPYDGSLSTNTHLILYEDELTPQLLNDPKLLFMDYVNPQEYKEFTVDMYYGRTDGKVKSIVPRERIAVRAGEINKGITRKNALVPYLLERMGHLEGVRGCICMQLFYRECDGDIQAIEINPRFGGGYPLSYKAKANFPEYIIREYLLNEEVAYSDNWLDKTLMLRYDTEVIIFNYEE